MQTLTHKGSLKIVSWRGSFHSTNRKTKRFHFGRSKFWQGIIPHRFRVKGTHLHQVFLSDGFRCKDDNAAP